MGGGHKPGRHARAAKAKKIGPTRKASGLVTRSHEATPPGPAPGVAHPAGVHPGVDPVQLAALREMFWCNVARDMLTNLSVLSQRQPELFDGRFAVLTRAGERIAIAQIEPLFACSVAGEQSERDLSAAVQCTVFRVQTPAGEVFTLPVHEVRALHALTPQLLERLQREHAEEASESGPETGTEPFGLAAFAALPKAPSWPPPAHPLE